jgi:hypothetical protein
MSYVELAYSLSAQDPKVLPSGSHKLLLKSATYGDSKKGRKQFAFMFIAAQESNIKPIFEYLAPPGQGETPEAANFQACRMRDLKAALGLEPGAGINISDVVITSDDGRESQTIDDPMWVGREVWAVLDEDEDEFGKKNRIKRFIVGQ